MTLWTLTFIFLIFGFSELKPLFFQFKNFLLQSQAILKLKRAIHHLHFLQEQLESGLVPETHAWAELKTFPAPWGLLIYQSVMELRNQGAAVLPTLSRMRRTLEEQIELIQESKAKSAQALGQAVAGMIMIPLFAAVLYFLLPGMEENQKEFMMTFIFSLFLGSLSFVWMLSMIDQARFGNLKREKRFWLVSVNASLERLMALISTGLPPDLAWKKMYEELAIQDRALALEWKSQIWDGDLSTGFQTGNECEILVINLGNEVKRSIQTSLIEGRGCLERIESIHRTFIVELRMKIERELNLLPNRCLKPLFVCILPAVFILLLVSISLSFQSQLL